MKKITQSPFWQLASQTTRLPHALIASLLALGFAFLGQILGGITYELIFRLLDYSAETPLLDGAQFAIELTLSFGFIVVFVAVWLYVRENRPISTLGFQPPRFLWYYSRGWLIGCAMFGLVTLITFSLGYAEFAPPTPEKWVGWTALAGVFATLPGWIIQGGTEEILTRGWLMQVVGVRHNHGLAIIISSVIFAVLHFLNPNVSYLAIFNLVLVSLFFAFYVLHEGGLWGVCAIHSAWNWAQGNLFGFEVSGQGARGGSLIDLTLVGPSWLAGGSFGPEGGAISSGVLLVSIFALLMLKMREDKKSIPA